MQTSEITANIAARETTMLLLEMIEEQHCELRDKHGLDAGIRLYELIRDTTNAMLPEEKRLVKNQPVVVAHGARNQSSRSDKRVIVRMSLRCHRYTDKAIGLVNDPRVDLIWLPRSLVRFPDVDTKSGLPACGEIVTAVELPEWLAYEKDLIVDEN